MQVVPSFVVLRGGKVAARVEGADPAAVARTITGALRSPADGAAAVAAAAPPAVPAEPLEDRLRRLIRYGAAAGPAAATARELSSPVGLSWGRARDAARCCVAAVTDPLRLHLPPPPRQLVARDALHEG